MHKAGWLANKTANNLLGGSTKPQVLGLVKTVLILLTFIRNVNNNNSYSIYIVVFLQPRAGLQITFLRGKSAFLNGWNSLNRFSRYSRHREYAFYWKLMAEGIANFLTPLFGGIPATGNIARTTTNIRTGEQIPISGTIRSLTLLVIVLVTAPLASHTHLAVLAAILLFVTWNMGKWVTGIEFQRLSKCALDYRVKMLSVVFLTIILDLTVEVGLVLAALSFIYRMSDRGGPENLDRRISGISASMGDMPGGACYEKTPQESLINL